MPQLDVLTYFSQMLYFYMFVVVLYFFLLVTVIPAVVRNLKFRMKAFSRLERGNLAYALEAKRGFVFRVMFRGVYRLARLLTRRQLRLRVYLPYFYYFRSASRCLRKLNAQVFVAFTDLGVNQVIRRGV